MRFLKLSYFILMALIVELLPLSSFAEVGAPDAVSWVEWSDQAFQKAGREKKLVLLNLEAVWCHWCHVMGSETYSKPEVIKLLSDRYIPIKVDQDSRPDLSARFREYGWPATIIFNDKGQVLAARAGYQESGEFVALLLKLSKDPKPEKTPSKNPTVVGASDQLTDELRTTLTERHYGNFDSSTGGLQTSHKYLEPDFTEFALWKAGQGSEKDSEMVQSTLQSNLKLLDPVWGGFYQYSTGGDWNTPHYEKVIHTQAANLRLYSLAYELFKKEEYLKAARATAGYLKDFLRSPDGPFYTSQDADLVKGEKGTEYFSLSDSARRAKGVPAIDKNIYSKENGQVVTAFTQLYGATLDEQFLDDALQAAQWIKSHRSLSGGGFMHGERDQGGPFLSDNLFMARAFLALYSVTGDRHWLTDSEGAANFVLLKFPSADGVGFLTAPTVGQILPPQPILEENIEAARFFNLLSHYSGNIKYKEAAHSAFRFISNRTVALQNLVESGILIADHELSEDPLHITVVGSKDEPVAGALFGEAIRYFSTYKRTEWWDKSEGPMPNSDVEYPQLPKPAAFVCTNKRCSLPIFDPAKIGDTIRVLAGKK